MSAPVRLNSWSAIQFSRQLIVERANGTDADKARSDLETVKQERDRLKRDNDALRGVPSQKKDDSTPLTAEERATKISIWDSVINSNLHVLIDAFNTLDLSQTRWTQLIKTADGRRQLYQDITNPTAAYVGASKDLEILRSEYRNFPDVDAVLDQPGKSELERTASNFANAISRIPENAPPNFDVQLRPLAGALKIQMDATQKWLQTVSTAANQNRKALSGAR
jgi:hypothetical protein